MKRTLLLVALCALLTVLPIIPAYAAWMDFDYEGALDKKTGDPAEDTGADNKGTILIGNGVGYDKSEKKYLYSVHDTVVRSNIPAGVLTSSSVSFDVPDGVLVRLYRDGEEITAPNLHAITDIGTYMAVFGTDEELKIDFTIVGEVTCRPTSYRLPEGFYLTSLYIDGEAVEDYSSVVDLSKEGKYQIIYSCPEAGEQLELDVLVDHTPPVLKLEAVSNGSAGGPVDISDLEKGTAIRIVLNGSPIEHTSVLTRSGDYEIRLQDPAGNITQYNFVIRVYFNFNSIAFIGILLLLIAGIIVYLVISRKKLRIR